MPCRQVTALWVIFFYLWSKFNLFELKSKLPFFRHFNFGFDHRLTNCQIMRHLSLNSLKSASAAKEVSCYLHRIGFRLSLSYFFMVIINLNLKISNEVTLTDSGHFSHQRSSRRNLCHLVCHASGTCRNWYCQVWLRLFDLQRTEWSRSLQVQNEFPPNVPRLLRQANRCPRKRRQNPYGQCCSSH